MDFFVALKSIGILLLMAIPGFIIVKTKLLRAESAVRTISVILLYLCQPFIIANSFLTTDFSLEILKNMLVLMLITAIMITITFFIAKMFFGFDKNIERQKISVYSAAFGNIGFMCIPFLQMMNASGEMILYASSTLIPFYLLCWTLGSYLMTGDKKYVSIKKAVFNVPTVAFLVILPLFIFNLNFNHYPMPSLQNAIKLFANLTAPLAMSMLGMRAAEMKLKDILLDWRGCTASLFKLFLQPAIAFLLFSILSIFGDFSALRVNIIAMAAMPIASNVIMFASLYKKDTGAATSSVLLSNIFAMFSIPIIFLLFA